MSREQEGRGLILKKQPLGEADELVTIFFAELGKVRAIAKAAKLPKSRLQFALQPLSVSQLTMVGRGALPQIIRATPVEQFSVCSSDLERLQLWYQVAELVIRFLPDSQPNEVLYHSVYDFLSWLNTAQLSPTLFASGFLKCELAILDAVGHQFALPTAADVSTSGYVFDVAGGGVLKAHEGTGTVVSPHVVVALRQARELPYAHIVEPLPEVVTAQQLVHASIVYALERDTRADRIRL